jgi:hypothetical protein
VSLVTKTVWGHLGVELPALRYVYREVETQQKSTTIYAAFSHTPTHVEDWEQFDSLIDTEKAKPENREQVLSVISHLIAQAPNHLNKVFQEEDVTHNACTMLNHATDLLKVRFIPGNKFVTANTDIIAMTASMENHSISDSPTPSSQRPDSGSITMYKSPKKRAPTRAQHMEEQKDKDLIPIETKPWWKYQELCKDTFGGFSNLWEVPSAPWKMGTKLPNDWSDVKKRVFPHDKVENGI